MVTEEEAVRYLMKLQSKAEYNKNNPRKYATEEELHNLEVKYEALSMAVIACLDGK